MDGEGGDYLSFLKFNHETFTPVHAHRGPEASGSQKRLVWQKNAILNIARPMKNSGTLLSMTFTEMAIIGHNRHSKSLNKQ